MQMEENSKRSRLIYGGEKDACFEKKATMAASKAGCSFRQWQLPSSRIFRVSRASGSKDRHSKVLTSKGLRDRRVRLSVSTAIQFYDLQDRLGYDQPSKAIEWLIEAASAAIDELPSLGSSFAELPSPSGEQNRASGCSSTSETSKSSVLSLSRSEICVKANHPHCSFTKLLTDQSASVSDAAAVTESGQVQVLPSHTQYLNGCPMVEMAATGDQLEMQQISFMQEHMDYNLNFAIGSSGLAGFQRGTLQSNSSVHLTQQHLHNNLLRFSSPSSSSSMVGPNLQFVAPALAASSAENFFCSGLDGRLQLSREPLTPFLLDGYRPSDLKGKGKN